MMKLAASAAEEGQTAYSEAGGIATEVISAMRTVSAFNAEQKSVDDYAEQLVEARKVGIKKALFSGIGMGVTMGLFFCAYALGLWWGGQLVLNDGWTGGDVMAVFFAVLVGGFNIGQAQPAVEAITAAKGAAFTVYRTIGTPSYSYHRSGIQDRLTLAKGQAPEEGQGGHRIPQRVVPLPYPTRVQDPRRR